MASRPPNGKIRLLFLASCLSNGGLERVLLTLLSTLDREKHEPVLVLLSGQGNINNELPADIKVITLYQRAQPERFYLVALRALTRLYREARRSDLIIGTCQPTHLLAKLLSLVSTKPALAWIHYVWGAQPLHGRWGALVKWAYKTTNNFVFVSPDAKNRFRDGLITESQASSASLRVLYNPIQRREAKSSTLPAFEAFIADNPKAQPILFVGRLVSVKNVSDLIKAVYLVRRNNPFAFLAIAGTGPLASQLKKEAEQLSETESLSQAQLVPPVLFLGEDSNPLPLMKRSGLLAMASTWESWGMVALEAMSQSCLVVAYDAPGGLREILQPEKEPARGLLVTERTPEALAEKLQQALQGNIDLSPMREAAESYASRFTPEATSQAWSDYLNGEHSPIDPK